MERKHSIYYRKITKHEFYAEGGFSNPKLLRVMRGKNWAYYKIS